MSKDKIAKVFYADLWGSRSSKYEALFEQDISTTKWQELKPASPFYLFVPQDISLQEEYEKGWKINDILPLYGVGMTTARDHIVIDFDPQPLIERAKEFRDSPLSDIEICKKLGIPLKKGWNIAKARELLREVDDLEQFLTPVLYRPFDIRLIFYHDSLVWRTVKRVMRHMLAGENVGIAVTRNVEIGRGFEHVFCTRFLIQHHTVSLKEVNYLFPLYLYPTGGEKKTKQHELHEVQPWPKGKGGRVPNLNPEFVRELGERLGLEFVPDGTGDLEKTFGPEDVLDYIYAVFHSPTYRERYAEFLRIDFPRVPLTSNQKLFRELCHAGKELVALHLLESPKLSERITRYPVKGDDLIDRGYPKYVETDERVYINRSQYFDGVPKEVWKFHIGGYQVCRKWLKDRRGRKLSYEELETYQKIVVAIAETITLMRRIDEIIESAGGWEKAFGSK